MVLTKQQEGEILQRATDVLILRHEEEFKDLVASFEIEFEKHGGFIV